MCGIYGYFDSSNERLAEATLDQMAASIEHRGPDGHGRYSDPDLSVAIGNQRLAILDVASGEQPFYSDDKQIVVVQNGEIFNHIELAHALSLDGYPCKTSCDTEVILRLYEREGINGLQLLNGMFAIAILDRRLKTLFLVRDRVGEKPLHFFHSGGRLVFGSEIKAILPAVQNFQTCPDAIIQFLAFNYVPPPLTMFKDIYHVQPGHYLEVTECGVTEHCWWSLKDLAPKQQSEAKWIEQFNEVIADAVRIRLRSDVPFGAFLSGGVDSSTVVGLMQQKMDSPVNTYCIGFHDPRYDESGFAETAATRFQTCHVTKKVEANLIGLWPMATYHCDQPHGDVSFLPTYKVAELASKDVKMVLTGDGADELFAGYDKYKHFFSRDVDSFSAEEFKSAYIENISLFSESSFSSLFQSDFLALASQAPSKRIEQALDGSEHFDRINQALLIDTLLLLPGNNLVKPDRMGMAVSIENRAPFLDFRMLELAFSMPGSLKLKVGETKYLYKKAVSPLIGEELAYRKKQMFTVPIGDWLKNELRPMVNDLLLSERAQKRGICQPDFVQRLVDEHHTGVSNHTREIRALMALELWFREFVDS